MFDLLSTHRSRLCQRAIAAVALSASLGCVDSAPAADRSKPPVLAGSAEGFALRTLDALRPIDGQDWVEVRSTSVPGRLPAPNGQFTLTLEEATSVEIVHYRISLSEAGAASVELDPGHATYAAITPDSRWVITGPFELIDVPNWRRYSLSTAFNLRAFIVLRAVSADGRRLLISQRACPFDCRDIPDRHFEITLPER